MIVVKTKPYDLISYQAIYEFEESFSNFENITYTIEKGSNKIVKRILNLIIKNKVIKYLPLFNNSNKENVFIILMNINNLYKLFSIYLKNKNISLYIYDLLKSQYNFFFDITNYLEIKNIFFSSKDTADFFNQNYKSKSKTNYYWLPEAIKPEEYHYEDYSKKDIDIISFGRRYNLYHEKILDSNFKYIYNKFKTHKDLVNSLAKSKISICFSSDLTNPNHFEDISKITMRYFQSMICKCLILGNAPNDMKYLFNYNPVIEANLEKPIKQIEDILSNYNKYIDLIETNYNEVINKHKYYDRIKLILQIF